jgi:hypothetical protein
MNVLFVKVEFLQSSRVEFLQSTRVRYRYDVKINKGDAATRDMVQAGRRHAKKIMMTPGFGIWFPNEGL